MLFADGPCDVQNHSRGLQGVASAERRVAVGTMALQRKQLLQISFSAKKRQPPADIILQPLSHSAANFGRHLHCWIRSFEKGSEAFQALRHGPYMAGVAAGNDLRRS